MGVGTGPLEWRKQQWLGHNSSSHSHQVQQLRNNVKISGVGSRNAGGSGEVKAKQAAERAASGEAPAQLAGAERGGGAARQEDARGKAEDEGRSFGTARSADCGGGRRLGKREGHRSHGLG